MKTVINVLAFLALMVATWVELSTPWGLLFLYWTIQNFRLGHAFIVTEVNRNETPVLFWLVQSAWLILGISMIVTDYLPVIA